MIGPSRVFRYIRYTLWLAGAVVLVWFLLKYTPWHTWLRKPDYVGAARPGVPVVKAIYEFRYDVGLWPQYLADLAPKYLPKPPGLSEWFYDTSVSPPQLKKELGSSGLFVGYDFDPQNRGWKAWGPFVPVHDLPVAQDAPKAPPPQLADMADKVLAEFDRRIKREPLIIEHAQSKAAVLKTLGRRAELRAFCETLKKTRPLNVWPRMALAVLELEDAQAAAGGATSAPASAPATAPTETPPAVRQAIGDPFSYLKPPATSAPASMPEPPSDPAEQGTTAGEQFVSWVELHPSLAHYFYVYTYARLAGDTAAALRAAEKAAQQPLGETTRQIAGVRVVELRGETDLFAMEYYAYRLARFLYQQQRYQAVIDLCNRWEVTAPKGEMSYYALRAAAELATSRIPAAEADIEKASIADDRRPTWAKNLPALAAAIRQRRLHFIYDPGPRAEYDPFRRLED